MLDEIECIEDAVECLHIIHQYLEQLGDDSYNAREMLCELVEEMDKLVD